VAERSGRDDPEVKPRRRDRLEVEGVGEVAEHVVRVAGEDLLTSESLQEAVREKRTFEVMIQGPASPVRLSQAEQRALASFLAGRLPAGQLHTELCRAREAALAAAAGREAPALRAA
jgi:hypothetical protein